MPSRRFLRSGRALSTPQCSAGVIARKVAFPKGLAHIDHEKVAIGPEFSSKGARFGQGTRCARPASRSAVKGPLVVSGLVPSCRFARFPPFLDWACRQLQYRSPLPGSEVGDKNDCTV